MNEYGIAGRKFTQPILQMIEQRILFYSGVRDLKDAEDSDPVGNIATFAKKFATKGLAKETVIESPYPKLSGEEPDLVTTNENDEVVGRYNETDDAGKDKNNPNPYENEYAPTDSEDSSEEDSSDEDNSGEDASGEDSSEEDDDDQMMDDD